MELTISKRKTVESNTNCNR